MANGRHSLSGPPKVSPCYQTTRLILWMEDYCAKPHHEAAKDLIKSFFQFLNVKAVSSSISFLYMLWNFGLQTRLEWKVKILPLSSLSLSPSLCVCLCVCVSVSIYLPLSLLYISFATASTQLLGPPSLEPGDLGTWGLEVLNEALVLQRCWRSHRFHQSILA